MTAQESRPGGTGAAPSLTPKYTGTRKAIVVTDGRCRARLTEGDLEPIDTALTFTGLAPEMREVAL